jgi:SAM-dependent methyltransferase
VRSQGRPGCRWERSIRWATAGGPACSPRSGGYRPGRSAGSALECCRSSPAGSTRWRPRSCTCRPKTTCWTSGAAQGSSCVIQAAGVRYVAGVDASEIQVGLARRHLAERIAAGTAQIIRGDAAALPWPDGRFSAAASVNCLKFVPQPDQALREIYRVLRPGGRIVHITDPPATDPQTVGHRRRPRCLAVERGRLPADDEPGRLH